MSRYIKLQDSKSTEVQGQFSESTINKDAINENLEPINNISQNITFNWMKPIIKKLLIQDSLNYCDIPPIHKEFQSFESAKRFSQQWNDSYKKCKVTGKKMNSVLNLAFKMNKSKVQWLFITVFLTSVCHICNPIVLQKFTAVLGPEEFYNCSLIFTGNPQFQQLNYVQGLTKVISQLWSYYIIIVISQFLSTATENISFSFMMKSAVTAGNGMLDIIYQKILNLSDQARANSASGNIVNLLYGDTQRITMMMTFMQRWIQIPIDFIFYLIYMGLKVNPYSLLGLSIYFIIFPLIGIVLKKQFQYQKKMMNIRDLRVKRTTEVLNGIKIIKLFRLEQIQEVRLMNVRNNEIKIIFRQLLCSSFFSLLSTAASPLMTIIAFIALTYAEDFDLSTAFTTMFMFQSLSQSFTMLPMISTTVSEASISSQRIAAFLKLPEKDQQFIIQIEQLNQIQRQVYQIQNDTILKFTGNPSFSWSLANDKEIPQILDPLYKEHSEIMKHIKLQCIPLQQEIKRKIQNFLNSQLENENNFLVDNNSEYFDFRTILNDDNFNISNDIIDKWCTELDIPQVSKLQSLEQYNQQNYIAQQNESAINNLKRVCAHLCTLKFYIQKEQEQKKDDSPCVLNNINFAIRQGELIGVCGQVGSGKSSLFHAILGEMRVICQGKECIDARFHELLYDYFQNENMQTGIQTDQSMPHLFYKGKIAFFPQNYHLFSKSIKENILFGNEYDIEKYQQAIRLCCLEDDLKIFKDGDMTQVGGKGVTLSGGQKARIQLARAVYADADIYLLDDPLSAVDSHVGKLIWENVIISHLKNRGKTVIIATHQTQFFNDCDRIMHLANSTVQAFDTVENIVSSGLNILGVIRQANNNENNKYQGKVSAMNDPGSQLKGKQNVEQLSGSGGIGFETYKKWFKAGSIKVAIYTIILLLIGAGIQQYQTILVSDWGSDAYDWTINECDVQCEEGKLKNVYFTDCGKLNRNYCNNKDLIFQTLKVGLETTKLAIPIFDSCIYEYDAEINYPFEYTSIKYLWLYFGLTVLLILLNYIGNVSLQYFCLTVAKKLNHNMVQSLIRAKMLFFDVTPQGRILNRMAKDTDALDTHVIKFTQQSVSYFLNVLGMILSISIVNWPCIFVIIPAVAVFLYIFTIFRKTSPKIKRLEATTRSPVFSLCQETTDCLISIRSYHLQKYFTSEFRKAVNLNSSLYFQQFGMNRWIFFRLGMLAGCFSMLITLIATLISPYSEAIATYTGILVSRAFSISSVLMNFVIMLVGLEAEMSAVERVVEYGGLEREGEYEIQMDKGEWPKKSSVIEVKNLSLRYRVDLKPVLNRISFTVAASEHIGVVGRTGAGKSSIMVAMYRLTEPDVGSEIVVDGVDILKIGLHQARRAFAIIPQDPFLFSGTLRQCLCPFSQAEAEGVSTQGMRRFDDAEIWQALENVQMKQYFINQPGGLNCKIAINGDNLSAGQKQLVCVARALLQNVCCILFDEATAQVDRETDQLIQQTIRSTLKDVAIISIAHRLDTIIDFDRVMVVDNGSIVEFDTPAELVRKGGAFLSLINNTGEENGQSLIKSALTSEKVKNTRK